MGVLGAASAFFVTSDRTSCTEVTRLRAVGTVGVTRLYGREGAGVDLAVAVLSTFVDLSLTVGGFIQF